jgi:hypothetical protein
VEGIGVASSNCLEIGHLNSTKFPNLSPGVTIIPSGEAPRNEYCGCGTHDVSTISTSVN